MITRNIVYMPVRDGFALLGLVAMHTERQSDLRYVIPILQDRSGAQYHAEILPFYQPMSRRSVREILDCNGPLSSPIVDAELAISARGYPIVWWRQIVGFTEVASDAYYEDRLRDRAARLERLAENAREILPALWDEIPEVKG